MTADDNATAQFLTHAPDSEGASSLFAEDMAELGFVMNVSLLWAYQPAALIRLFELMTEVTSERPFTLRERGILVTACASTLGDSYCSLAWGTKLAQEAGEELAAGVMTGQDAELSPAEQAMAAWARQVARDPNATSPGDLQRLRDAGFTESDIFAMTVFVGLRLAFSTVNDALGARPDAQYQAMAPAGVRAAVSYGRPMATPR